MYEIQIESEDFKAKRIVQQHQMVNQVSRSTGVLGPLDGLKVKSCLGKG